MVAQIDWAHLYLGTLGSLGLNLLRERDTMRFRQFIKWGKGKLSARKNEQYQISRRRHFEHSPLEIKAELNGECFVKIPAARCRTSLFGFTLGKSPFVRTLSDYGRGACNRYQGSFLEHFYSACQPGTMAEVLALENERMQEISAMATVMPWWTLTPEACLVMNAYDPDAVKLLSREAGKSGLDEKTNFGWQFSGPVSDEVGELEFERLSSVYDSIQKRGFLYKKTSAMHGEFLLNGDDWVWVNLGGKHRVSALAVLGEDQIPVTVKCDYSPHYVQRDEVATWFNVASGLFTQEEALKVFDAMLQGDQSTILISVE